MDDSFSTDIPKNVKGYPFGRTERIVCIDGFGPCKFVASEEYEQDMLAVSRSLFTIRTPPISEYEITEWQDTYNYLQEHCRFKDFAEIKKKFKLQILKEYTEEYDYFKYNIPEELR